MLKKRKFIENPLPMLQTTIAVKKPEQREIIFITEIDGDPLLKYYVDTTTHDYFVQMEVILGQRENIMWPQRKAYYIYGKTAP